MTRRFLSKRLTDDARGKSCLLQVAGVAYHNTETVVACHCPTEWKGMGIKSPDWASVRGCLLCHRIVDGVDNDPLTGVVISEADANFYWKRGLTRQWDEWIRGGLLNVA